MSTATQDNDYQEHNPNAEPAVNIARAKLEALYAQEPDAKKEEQEAKVVQTRSKHQQYMYDLSTSGSSLAEIQSAWHKYYQELPDAEKHAVWHEFYSASGQEPPKSPVQEAEHKQPQPLPTPPPHVARTTGLKPRKPRTATTNAKKRIMHTVTSGSSKVAKNQHLRSMIFGISMGALVMVVLLFSFFNERFVAPFITPSRSVSSTPIIIDPSSSATGPQAEVIIPKINVEIPAVYTVETIDEGAIQKGLEGGVVHYSTTPNPGQKGNSVFVGHSSNNIFNQGKYKFAFVLLNKLEVGDTFYLSKNGVRYAYRIFDKKIVKPSDVSVLGASSKAASATLITCDPPGTSLNRLVVVGEQISPDPTKNTESTASQSGGEPQIVPGNAPSLWHRLTHLRF